MIDIQDKKMCTGCTACMNSCPVGCITMKEDVEGFLYPSVDSDKCIGCNRCVNVCPFNDSPCAADHKAYAVRTSFESTSSSGGAISSICARYLTQGWSIYGAAFDKNLDVVHIKAADEQKLASLSTSKYLQSRLDMIFSAVRNDLSGGQKVLFVGTPCQVAGLRSFIGENDDLLTVQIACHGVPSAKLWKAYLHSLETSFGEKIQSVNFRDKSNGWKRYNIAYTTASGISKVQFDKDTYMLAYLQNLSLRPSCYDCRFRGSAYADLVAGDFWNIAEALPDHDGSKGFTLLSAVTPAGSRVIEELASDAGNTLCIPVDFSIAKRSNSGYAQHVDMPQRREEFFDGLYDNDDLIGHMEGFIERKSKTRSLYARLHTFLSGIKKKIIR